MSESRGRTDSAVLAQLGERLARHRLERNLTQVELAKEAGVSQRTLSRIEGGESTQATNLIRVLRALGLLANLDALVPPPVASPIQALRTRGKRRKRASRATEPPKEREWSWDDGEEEADGGS